MSKITEGLVKKLYDKTVETKYAETRWPVYETYQLHGVASSQYVFAPTLVGEHRNGIREYLDPFSPEHAALFLQFARWFDSQKMEGARNDLLQGLDTERNVQAALAWAHTYGVLGLGANPNSTHAVVGNLGSSSSEIAAEHLGVPHLGHRGTRAYRMSAEGGKHETVEVFVLEAYEANVVLKLYEAVSTRTVNVPAISRFMPDTPSDFDLHLLRRYGRTPQTERELWSQDEELAKLWALGVVENAVNRKVEKSVYHTLQGERGSYEEGWGFKSLLGAMWLQMRWFMLGDRDKGLCPRCGELFPKTRRDKEYCGDDCSGKVRAARQHARKKQREKEARKATRRRLRR